MDIVMGGWVATLLYASGRKFASIAMYTICKRSLIVYKSATNA